MHYLNTMKTEFSAYAHTDLITLFGVMPKSLFPVSLVEAHLYCYLGNVIAVSNGLVHSEWGYSFAVSSIGFPYSGDLHRAAKNLVSRSVLVEDGVYLQSGGTALEDQFCRVSSLGEAKRRLPWLEATTRCALNLPKGAIRSAIHSSPGFPTSVHGNSAVPLMQDLDASTILDEFGEIREMLGGESIGLLKPAILWLTARVLRGVASEAEP